MSEMAKAGFNPVVITSNSNNLHNVPTLNSKVVIVEQDGVTLVWLRTLRYEVAKSLKRIMSWFHFEWNLFRLDKAVLPRPDVVVVSSLSILTVINGLLLKRKYGCRLVFEVRDIWPLTIVEEGGFSANNPFVLLLSIVEKLGYKKSDAIIGTMPNLVQHVQEVLGSESQVYCVPMGVSEDQLTEAQPLGDDYKKSYLSSKKTKIVHAGTIGITNALDVFFEAAYSMKDRNDLEFIVVGDGSLKNHYMNLYANLGNVVFAPKVARKQVQSVLKECDLVYFSVHKSKVWNYGQSLNKVIDYMLSGKPVIASYSGFPSMIDEAACGSFVPAGDVNALVSEIKRYVALSPTEREAIGARGRNWLLQNRPYSKLAADFSRIVFGK